MTDIDAIWVISDVAPDGTYVASIQAGPDRAITLDRDAATAYAMTVLDAVARAEYDAAVLAQLTSLGIGVEAADASVVDLRNDRPPLPDEATAPLRFVPLVTSGTREPAIHVALDGHLISQWTPQDAKGHAMHVLEVVAAVDMDAAYLRYLRGPIGLDEPRARAVVGELCKHRIPAEGHK